MLIVFGGLPGVGKTVLSRALAARLDATWLRVDAIEAAMWRVGIERGHATGLGAYVVAHAVASAQLGLGRPVVVDAVNPVAVARAGWRDLAAEHDVAVRLVEVTCSDRAEHERRVLARAASADQPDLPTWDEVSTWAYEPWSGERLTVDTAGERDDVLARVVAYCAG